MPSTREDIKAIRIFKVEYLLDFINVEDIDTQEKQNFSSKRLRHGEFVWPDRFLSAWQGQKYKKLGLRK